MQRGNLSHSPPILPPFSRTPTDYGYVVRAAQVRHGQHVPGVEHDQGAAAGHAAGDRDAPVSLPGHAGRRSHPRHHRPRGHPQP